jgi:hypothetical protein
MNDEEHSSLTSNTRHTKATAYMAAFCVLLCTLVCYFMLTIISEDRATIKDSAQGVILNSTDIKGLSYRVASAEERIQEAKAERDELKGEWLAAVNELKDQLKPLARFVTEQKVRAEERERLERKSL